LLHFQGIRANRPLISRPLPNSSCSQFVPVEFFAAKGTPWRPREGRADGVPPEAGSQRRQDAELECGETLKRRDAPPGRGWPCKPPQRSRLSCERRFGTLCSR
jgi:hypothetical protein